MSTALDPQRWRLLRPLLDEALELEGEARQQYLARIGREQAELLPDLQRLLAHHTQESSLDQHELIDAVETLRSDIVRAAAAPTHAGPWELVQHLGTGGMGEVWRARRTVDDFEQVAALKLLRVGMDSHLLIARFLQERRILARLDHPWIARLLDGGMTLDGRPYFAMELVHGEPIDAYIARTRPSTAAILRLFINICAAVDYAHRNLIVHRDLKPSNVLIDAEGRPKLLDFGIAKLVGEDAHGAATQLWALTPAYAAPEQFNGDAVTTATDVYALGLLLYEVIAGTLPPERAGLTPAQGQVRDIISGPVQRLRRRREDAPLGLRSLGRDLDAIVLTALQSDPQRRYPTAAALADDLRRLLDGHPVSARPDTLAYRTRRFVARHRAAVAAATAALLALFTGLGLALWQAGVAREAAERMRLAMEHAEAESMRSQAARDFLLDLFESANPSLAGGDARRTVREVLLSADAKLERSLADDPLTQAELRLAMAMALRGHGEADTAWALVQAALVALDDGADRDPALLGVALQTRAAMHITRGDLAAAETDVRRALDLLGRAPPSPKLANQRRAAVTTLATVYSGTGREAAALDLRRRDLEERSAELGADSPELATSWYNLGISNLQAERLAESLDALRRTESIMAPQGDVASPRQVFLSLALVNALAALGRFDEADRYLARARAVIEDPEAGRPDLLNVYHGVELTRAMLAADLVRAEAAGRRWWAEVEAGRASGDVTVAGVQWAAVLIARARGAEAEAVAAYALEHSRQRRGDDHPVTLHLQAAHAAAGHLQRRDDASLARLLDAAERLRQAPTRRQFGMAAAWLSHLLHSRDPASAARWAAESDAALAAVYGAAHPWSRTRAGVRAEPGRAGAAP